MYTRSLGHSVNFSSVVTFTNPEVLGEGGNDSIPFLRSALNIKNRTTGNAVSLGTNKMEVLDGRDLELDFELTQGDTVGQAAEKILNRLDEIA